MTTNPFYNEILTEHNVRPEFKHDLPDADLVLDGVNPSCGDDINLQLTVQNGVIEDAAFNGSGCAVSQASADMMCDLVIGRTEEEALHLASVFMGMIKGTATEEEKEELDEAASLEDVAHMPARVKCATLGWRTMKEVIEKLQKDGITDAAAQGSGSDSCGSCEPASV